MFRSLIRPSSVALATILCAITLMLGGSAAGTSERADTLEVLTPEATSSSQSQALLAPTAAAVDVRDYVFEDEASKTSDTTIAVGGTVTWTVSWGDHSITHTLSRAAGVKTGLFFDSGYKCSYGCGKGDTFTQTFKAPGVHTYYCLVHPATMQGTVTVVA